MKLNKIGHKILTSSSLSLYESGLVIKNELLKDKPLMIARFGAVEIKAILYPFIPKFFKATLRNTIFTQMEINAGFFPSNDNTIRDFSQLLLEDMKELDILASWRPEERFLKKYLKDIVKVDLKSLEPYLSNNPWSEALKGKKVLVIHPFSETIKKQYNEKRELLFSDKRVLPEFSLDTIKAVQTIAGNKSEFESWFAALNSMKSLIDKQDFDIAIIGCGAYGFSLAAHVKRLGKKAVHLGGATQMLFGIKGKRWENNMEFKDIININFINPSISEIPQNSLKVEAGCYW